MAGSISPQRAHHQAFQRRHTHGGIDAASLVYCGYGSAVTQVAGDDLELADVTAQILRSLHAHILVRSSVEAVAADLMFFIKLQRKG